MCILTSFNNTDDGRKEKKETEREERKKRDNKGNSKRQRDAERERQKKRKRKPERQDRLTDKKISQITGLSDTISSSSREAGAGGGEMKVKTACCSNLK